MSSCERVRARRTARFNWHRDLIVAPGRQPAISSRLVRALLR
jgi:hypothetical protein